MRSQSVQQQMTDRYHVPYEIISNMIKLITDSQEFNDEQFIHLSQICKSYAKTTNKYDIYFKLLDVDNDGYIGVQEIHNFLTKIGFSINQDYSYGRWNCFFLFTM
ncbi:EF-hand_domain [Hexamita inflata]|uniref:EF-hand_domain n=1 Tax=Hexamita inflata TaxID=28002 RepID=A0ABP1GS13_9EUKA